MEYRKLMSLTLAAALSAGLLAGCGEKEPPVPEETAPAVSQIPGETEAPAPEETSVPQGDSLSFEAQIATLAATLDTWRMEEEDWGELSWYAYAVCDLDRNGRLEVLGTTTQGTGMFTTNYMWEINEAGDGVESRIDPENPTTISVISGEDGTIRPYPAYYDREADLLWVEYNDVVRNGAAEVYESTEVLALKDGVLMNRPLAFALMQYDPDGNETVSYEGPEGQEPITQEEYENAGALAFPGMEPQELYLEWLVKPGTGAMSLEELTAALTASAEGFRFGGELAE